MELTHGPAGRAHTIIDGITDREHWSFGGLVEIHERAGPTHVERRIPGPHGIVATLRHSDNRDTVVYAHGDGRANRVFTDETGAVVQAPTYTTFGLAYYKLALTRGWLAGTEDSIASRAIARAAATAAASPRAVSARARPTDASP